MKISIILLNYNNENDTIECVESIKENCRLDCDIIVVDNKSSQSSIDFLREKSSLFTLILNKENVGFAAGNNVGIKFALENGADYILLLNNDTIVTPNSIEKMVNCIESDESTGIASCRIMYNDCKTKVWYCGGKMDWSKYRPEHFNIGNEFDYNFKDVEQTYYISGCCMLIPRDIFKNVGLLPEEYFMYYEDVDYCQQVVSKGYKLMLCSDAIIYHKVSSSSGGENSPFSILWGTRNKLIFMKKYRRRFLMISKLYFYLELSAKYILFFFKGEKEKAKAIINGVREGIKYIK